MKGKAKKQEIGKESMLDKYARIRATLIQACSDCGFIFEQVFPEYTVDYCKGMKDPDIHVITIKMEDDLRLIIKQYCLELWNQTIDENFDSFQKRSMYDLVKTMIDRDPSSIYLSLTNTCDALDKLCKEEEKLAELNYLESYSSINSIEDVANNYGMLFYSIYRDDAINAFKKGFGKNANVNYEYVSAYFGEPAQKGE